MTVDRRDGDAGLISDGLVVVTAPWCGHCRAMQSDIDEVAATSAPDSFQQVDVSVSPELASQLGVKGTPTVLVMRDGEVIARRFGRLGRTDLDRLAAAGGSGQVSLEAASRDARLRAMAGALLIGAGAVVTQWALVLIGFAIVVWAAVGYCSTRR